MAAPHLRRWRLCGRQAAPFPGEHGRLHRRGHKAFGHDEEFRNPTQTMARRAHRRMARPIPPPRKRLGTRLDLRHGVALHRPYPCRKEANGKQDSEK